METHIHNKKFLTTITTCELQARSMRTMTRIIWMTLDETFKLALCSFRISSLKFCHVNEHIVNKIEAIRFTYLWLSKRNFPRIS